MADRRDEERLHDTIPAPPPLDAVHVFGAPCPVHGMSQDGRMCDGELGYRPADGVEVVYHRRVITFVNGSHLCEICGEMHSPVGEEPIA